MEMDDCLGMMMIPAQSDDLFRDPLNCENYIYSSHSLIFAIQPTQPGGARLAAGGARGGTLRGRGGRARCAATDYAVDAQFFKVQAVLHNIIVRDVVNMGTHRQSPATVNQIGHLQELLVDMMQRIRSQVMAQLGRGSLIYAAKLVV